MALKASSAVRRTARARSALAGRGKRPGGLAGQVPVRLIHAREDRGQRLVEREPGDGIVELGREREDLAAELLVGGLWWTGATGSGHVRLLGRHSRTSDNAYYGNSAGANVPGPCGAASGAGGARATPRRRRERLPHGIDGPRRGGALPL